MVVLVVVAAAVVVLLVLNNGEPYVQLIDETAGYKVMLAQPAKQLSAGKTLARDAQAT